MISTLVILSLLCTKNPGRTGQPPWRLQPVRPHQYYKAAVLRKICFLCRFPTPTNRNTPGTLAIYSEKSSPAITFSKWPTPSVPRHFFHRFCCNPGTDGVVHYRAMAEIIVDHGFCPQKLFDTLSTTRFNNSNSLWRTAGLKAGLCQKALRYQP